MIVTIGNTKGGVGKTTVAINLAIARAMDDKDVWLIDADRQATAQTAIGIRAESNITPMVSCSSYSEGKILHSQLRQQKDKYDDVIIDAGGRDSSSLRASLVLSDILLIPVQPKSFDIWALDDLWEIVEEAKIINQNLKCFSFLNFSEANKSSIDNLEACKTIEEFEGIVFLDAPLVRRKAFSNASSQGLCVFELRPKDTRANEELKKLYGRIFED